MEEVKRINRLDILNYEVHSHVFAKHIHIPFLQELMSKYFAWKVRRKYNRYLISLQQRNEVLTKNQK